MSFELTTRWTAAFALVTILGAAGCRQNTEPTREEPSSARAASVPGAEANAKAKDAPLPPPPAVKLETVKEQTAKAKSEAPKAGAPKAKDSEEAKTAKPEAISSDGVTLKRLVVTNAIENREPAAVSQLSLGEGPVIAFVELKNSGSEDAAVVVTFEHAGLEPVGYVHLKVPAESRRWRTWARTRMIKKTGSWDAVVRTTDGKELARESFTIGS
ncbi:MAG: DUF2914 domain-containing protein [Myxococcales bacterium]|nr:DUF2914 domain-containing protein [Myxococcales bacterium]MCB9580865.1 DUF2914 domain-containing protein [Polyangiaceae bacterium]